MEILLVMVETCTADVERIAYYVNEFTKIISGGIE